MTALHPAVYGALYVALREHEESKASAESVAELYDVTESIAYHASAIAGLQEAIGLLHAGDADAAEGDRIAAELGAETPDPLEGAEVRVTRVELVPAARSDEDQPATPARGHGQDGDADIDFEFAPISAEDYATEQAAFDAANVEIAAKLARERRIAAAQACEGSCAGEGVCAFGPHDPITTPTIVPIATEEAP